MALYDAADLLSQAKTLFNRPATDSAMTDAIWYLYLEEGQRRVVSLLATNAPETMYGAPTKLVTADGGLTYTFGLNADTGLNHSPVGHLELRDSPTGMMIPPGSEWDISTLSYLFESDTIRWPGQKSRTFSDGPYARFITMPGLLDATHAPMLKPVFLRELCVYDACERAAVRVGIDPTPYGSMFDARYPELLMTVSTAFMGAGRTATAGASPGLWYRGRSA